MIFGTITSITYGEGLALQIDGESSPTTKKYMWLAPYYPKVGDRVLVEEVAGSYVILGSVTNDRNMHVYCLKNNINNADQGLVGFGIRGGDLYFGLVPLDGGSYTLYKLQKA